MCNRNALGPYAPRVQEYLERMVVARNELATGRELAKKRPASDEPIEGADDTKRRKLEQSEPQTVEVEQPPMEMQLENIEEMSEEKTIANLFKIGAIPTVDVRSLGEDQLHAIIVPLLQMANKQRLAEATQVSDLSLLIPSPWLNRV